MSSLARGPEAPAHRALAGRSQEAELSARLRELGEAGFDQPTHERRQCIGRQQASRVTSLSDGGSGGEDRTTQNITLDYQTIRYTVNNAPNASQTAGYSKITNKPT